MKRLILTETEAKMLDYVLNNAEANIMSRDIIDKFDDKALSYIQLWKTNLRDKSIQD